MSGVLDEVLRYHLQMVHDRMASVEGAIGTIKGLFPISRVNNAAIAKALRDWTAIVCDGRASPLCCNAQDTDLGMAAVERFIERHYPEVNS